jgi:hypothetical protein
VAVSNGASRAMVCTTAVGRLPQLDTMPICVSHHEEEPHHEDPESEVGRHPEHLAHDPREEPAEGLVPKVSPLR